MFYEEDAHNEFHREALTTRWSWIGQHELQLFSPTSL